MRLIIVLTFTLFLFGCGIVPCIDAQFEREPEPIEGSYNYQVKLANGETYHHTIKCERYYDAMCAARGNSWRVREVGGGSTYQSSTLPLPHDLGGNYELELPTCSTLIRSNGVVSLKNTHIVLDRKEFKVETTESGITKRTWLGKRYRYVSSNQGIHLYQRGGYGKTPKEKVEISFDLTLNGVMLSEGNF